MILNVTVKCLKEHTLNNFQFLYSLVLNDEVEQDKIVYLCIKKIT
jgi:hypothetical protein